MKNMLFSKLIMSIIMATTSCYKNEAVSKTLNDNNTVLTPQNAKDFLVDKNATPETVALFYNLKQLSKTQFAVGQQEALISFYTIGTTDALNGSSDIKKTVGKDPVIVGSDLSFVTDNRNDGTSSNWFYQQEMLNLNQIKLAYSKGMVNTVSWHLRGPKNKYYPTVDNEEYTFYTKNMFDTDKNTFFRSILPGGIRHGWFKAKLDQVASFALRLKGKKGEMIPFIFRPFHEFDGDFFWWGAPYSNDDEFKTIFKFIVTYLRDTKNVHNILYNLGPDRGYDIQEKFLSRYPGDDYVDVFTVDDYWSFGKDNNTGVHNYPNPAEESNKRLKVISDLAKSKTKIAAMGETGFYIDGKSTPINGWFSNWVYNAMTSNSVELSYVMFWSNDKNGYFVPTSNVSNAEDFQMFITKPKVTMLKTLPNMYKLP